jgi:hypothetical protein
MFLSPQRAQHNLKDVEYPGLPLSPGQIRLIRLLPGKWTDPIRCELFEDLHGTTRYQALSYVWGSQHVTQCIFLDRREFPVTFNLKGALRHLREHFKDAHEAMVFWVDALCINQKDIEERTSQVQLMGSIYENCQQVVVYLGDSLDYRSRLDKPCATRKLGTKNAKTGYAREGSAELDACNIFSLFQELAGDKHLTEIPAYSDIRQLEVSEMLRRMMHPPFTPWWSRVWVIQEVAVAPRVLMVHGSVSGPWEMFSVAATNYVKHSRYCCSETVAKSPPDQAKVLKDCCSRILSIDELRVRNERIRLAYDESTRFAHNQFSLLNLLRKFRDRRASDPRDKVYALVNLASVLRWERLKPDYSLSEIEVFRQATHYCIYETQSLSVFNTDLGRKFRNDLPSWVPDWSAPGGPVYEARAAAAELYNAWPSGDVAMEDIVHETGRSGLSVESSWVQTIDQVGDVMWGGDAPNIWQSTLWCWKGIVLTVTGHDGARFEAQDFWRLICGDVVCRNEDVTQSWSQLQRHDELTCMTWALQSPKSPFDPSLSPDVQLTTMLQKKFWSEEGRIWGYIQMLWPHQPVLAPITQTGDQPPDDLDPRRPVMTERGRDLAIQMLLNALGFNGNKDLKDSRDAWRALPWRDIFAQARKRLIQKYGDGVDLDPESHQRRVPDIDNSVVAATLSRRLIVSGSYVGLGPADARVDDELFLIRGGKTPFVLRATNAEPTITGPKYEIVGDCYIHGLMDGAGVPLRAHKLQNRITLL